MNEGVPNQFEGEKERMKQEYFALAKELSENSESFPFPGIDPEVREHIREDQEKYPGYSTPIDPLVARFEEEGLKVVVGKYPESDVIVVPFHSSDSVMDSLSPKDLKTGGHDSRLERLIEANRNWANLVRRK
ncbi:MAG: hypothetical protein KBD16_02965 [Candidatus Pacebacteria bacterium]|nr:hypothetical protein [Candidatus Paceibacterota bacterium]